MFNLLLPFHPLCFLRYMLTSGFGTTRFGFSAFFRRKPLSHRHRRIIRIFIDVALHQTARLRQTLIKTLTAEFLYLNSAEKGKIGWNQLDAALTIEIFPSPFIVFTFSSEGFRSFYRFEFLIGFNLFIQHKFCFASIASTNEERRMEGELPHIHRAGMLEIDFVSREICDIESRLPTEALH